jgi:hypothetical protein
MKAKKALKKLDRVEELLSDVVDRYAAGDHVVHEFLDTAIAAIDSAKKTLAPAVSQDSGKKPPTKSAKVAAAAKKAAAPAPKRRPNGADSARHMTKTA